MRSPDQDYLERITDHLFESDQLQNTTIQIRYGRSIQDEYDYEGEHVYIGEQDNDLTITPQEYSLDRVDTSLRYDHETKSPVISGDNHPKLYRWRPGGREQITFNETTLLTRDQVNDTLRSPHHDTPMHTNAVKQSYKVHVTPTSLTLPRRLLNETAYAHAATN